MTLLEETIATGRRKTAVASIRLRRGTGKIDVNGKAFDNYAVFPRRRKTAGGYWQTTSN